MVTRRQLVGAGLLAAGATAVGVGTTVARRRGVTGPPELRIATGPPGAVFREVGTALAEVLGDALPGTRVRAIPTGASVDNLALLDSGDTDLALASLDATVAGIPAGRAPHVAAVARLYDSWVQLLVPRASPVGTLADLAGRRVAAGADGSGTRFTTERLLALVGVRAELVTANQDEAVAALAAGTVDAFFTLTGVPTPAVTRLARMSAVRMVPLGEFVTALNNRFGELYTPATLPSSAYPGVSAAETMTTPNLLLAQPDLPDDLVELVAATLFARRDRIARGHPEANRINTRTGIATGPVPLHPGAVRYFRSVKA
ncbi:TAXI family TRAP transporter solute-binding subunit [Longispora urticae]